MRMPPRDFLRDRVPALVLAALLQLAAVWLIIHSLMTPEPEQHEEERETQIVLLPMLPPTIAAKRKPLRPQTPASGAITPFFNPYTFNPQSLAAPRTQGLAFALSACDIGNYDIAPDEIRAACDRIGALIKHDPGHYGLTSDVVHSGHWARELARREAPVLAPCMSPGGVFVDFFCVYNFLLHPYDPEKRARYSK